MLALLGANVLLLGGALWLTRADRQPDTLNFMCESTLSVIRAKDADNKNFKFEGTVLVRFKSDKTGYLWLLGSADYGTAQTNVAREVTFTYRSKDEGGIYAITPTAQNVTPRDNTPGELIERQLIGTPGKVSSYVVRQANANTYSIGSIYTPFMMCVDRS
ncbi:hypothetical protein RJ498_003234 [Pluralibacter gergoviae]